MGTDVRRRRLENGLKAQMNQTEMLPNAESAELEKIKKLTVELLSRCKEHDDYLKAQPNRNGSSVEAPSPKRPKMIN
jgi:hypothetical protein